MKTQRFSKVIIFTVCILLVFAVAAALLFSSNSSLPANDNVIADSGEGAGEVASATASTNAPLEDGSVPSGYSPASGATGTTSIDTIRSNPSGNYYLTGEMYIEEMDYSTNQNTTFSGTFDGCGNTIYVSVGGQNYGKEGGALFTGINGGTIKNVKIVVNKFSYGNVGTDEDRKAGIIAAYMVNGATINNVRVELNYVPTTSTTGDNMQNDNTYYVDTKTHDKATKYTYLGGLVGTSEDGNNTISNCTVVNNATGAGFGANVKNIASAWSGSVNSTLAVGLFVGSTISNNTSATLNMTNIRVKFGTGAVISSNHYQTSNGKRNYYAGAVLGWVKSETTAKFDGVIYDTAIDKDNYIKSANFGTNYKGTLYGYNEGGTVNVTDIYASSAISNMDGASNSIPSGVILTNNGTVAAFDKNNSGNVIVKTTYNAPSSSSLKAYASVAGISTYIMDAVMASDSNGATDGQTAYVSVAKSGKAPQSSTQSVSFTNANVSGTISVESYTSVTDEGYYSSRSYNGQAVPDNRSLSLSNGTSFPSAYAAQSPDKVAGKYTYTFSGIGSTYSTVRYNGLTYIYKPNENTVYQPNGVDITKNQIVEILPLSVSMSSTGASIEYGQTAESVQSALNPTLSGLISGDSVKSVVMSGYAPMAQNAGEDVSVGFAFSIQDSSGRDVSSSYSVTGTPVSVSVTQKPVTITANDAEREFGEANPAFGYKVTEGEIYEAFTVSYTCAATEASDKGAYYIVPKVDTFDKIGNYNISYVNGTLTVNPKTVVITVNSAYPDATASSEYSGVWAGSQLAELFVRPNDINDQPLYLAFDIKLVNGEELEEATVEYVGTYKITATILESYTTEDEQTVYQTNYTAAPCEFTLTITAKEIEVALIDGAVTSKPYDGNVVSLEDLAALFEVKTDIAQGSKPELDAIVTEGEVKNAGEYNVSVDLKYEYKNIYAVSSGSVKTTTYTVEQIVVDGSVTAPDDSVYDGTVKEAAFAFTGDSPMVGKDEIYLTYTTKEGTTTSNIVSAGTYIATAHLPAFAEGKSNYKWASGKEPTGTFTITPAEAAVEWGALSLTYNKAAQAPTASAKGVGEETVALKVSVTEGSAVTVGTYNAVATTENTNYTLTNSEKTFEIIRANLSLSVSVASPWTYGEASGAISINGNEENGTVTYAYVSTDEGIYDSTTMPANAGAYKLTITVAETDNYNEGTASCEITINKASLTDNTSDTVATYSGDAHGLEIALEGFKYSDSLENGVVEYSVDGTEGSWSQTAVTATDYTETPVTVYYRVTFDNYNTVTDSKTITVNAKQIEVVWSDLSQTYTGDVLKPTAAVSQDDIVGEDVVTVDVTTKSGDEEVQAINVGTYAAAAATSNPNYELTNATEEFAITAADFETEVQIDNWTFGQTASKPSVTYNPGSGEVTYKYSGRGDTAYAESETAPANAGTYTVTATIAASGNYAAKTVSADFEIAKKQITAPAIPDEREYDITGGEIVFMADVTEGDYTVTGGVAATKGKHTVTIALTDKNNTEWSDGGTDDITVDWAIVDPTKAYVTNADELDAALANGDVTTIIIDASFDYDKALTIARNVEIDLNGYSLTFNDTVTANNGAVVKISDSDRADNVLTFNKTLKAESATLTFDGIKASVSASGTGINVSKAGAVTLNDSDVTINSTSYAVMANAGSFAVEGGTLSVTTAATRVFYVFNAPEFSFDKTIVDIDSTATRAIDSVFFISNADGNTAVFNASTVSVTTYEKRTTNQGSDKVFNKMGVGSLVVSDCTINYNVEKTSENAYALNSATMFNMNSGSVTISGNTVNMTAKAASSVNLVGITGSGVTLNMTGNKNITLTNMYNGDELTSEKIQAVVYNTGSAEYAPVVNISGNTTNVNVNKSALVFELNSDKLFENEAVENNTVNVVSNDPDAKVYVFDSVISGYSEKVKDNVITAKCGDENITAVAISLGTDNSGLDKNLINELVNANTLPEGYVEVEGVNVQAVIDGVTYLYNGISGAISESDGKTSTITLLEDISGFNVGINGTLTIDLNGHNVVSAGTSGITVVGGTGEDAVLNLVITNSNKDAQSSVIVTGISANDDSSAIYVYNNDIVNYDAVNTKYRDVTLSNITFSAPSYALGTNGKDMGGVIVAENCKFIATGDTGAGAYLPGKHNVTFTDCEISGATGVYARSGSVTVSGGSIKSTSETYVAPQNVGGGFTASGSAFVADACELSGYQGELSVKIENCEITTTATDGYGIELVATGSTDDDFTNLTAIESNKNFFYTTTGNGFNDNMDKKVEESKVTVVKNTPEVTATVSTDKTVYTSTDITAVGISLTAKFGEKDVTGKIVWVSGQKLEAGTLEYNWTFTPDDTDNYEVVTGKSAIEVEAVALESITATFNPGENVIYSSATLDDLKHYLTVSGTNNDGTPYDGTIEYTLSGIIKAGTCEITVTVKDSDISATFNVEVTAVEVVSIEASGTFKTEYVAYEDFDATGMTVTATYSDGKSKPVTDYLIEGGTDLRVGTTSVKVTFGNKEDEVEITVNKRTVTAPVAASDLEYDGTEKTGVAGGNYYTVADGTATNADNYTATVTLTDTANTEWASGDDNKDGVIEVTWSIAKATYNMSGVKFADKTVTYNGAAQSIAVTGTLPAGVTVTYSGGGTNVGEYTVTATFSGDAVNYNAIASRTATLTIVKATYDMSGVEFGDKTVTYNGAVQSITVTGTLPAGVTVTYSGEGTTVGEYTVTATFSGDTVNYNAIADMTAKLTIGKATYDMSGVRFENKTVVENGEAQSVEIEGTLPDGVTVTYEGNGQTAAGVYTVTATFSGDTVNYNEIADMTATLTVNVAEITYTDDEETTDVVVSAEEGINPEYELVVERVEKVEIADVLSEGESVSAAFNVFLQKDGEVVQTDGEVTVRIRVPNEIVDGDYVLYALSGDNAIKLEYEKAGEFIVFRTNELTQFAFVVSGEQKGSATWLIITLAAIVLIEIIAIALKKRKDKKDKSAYVAAGIFGGAIATYETVLLVVFGAAAVILAIYLVYLFIPGKKKAEETAGEATEIVVTVENPVPAEPQVIASAAAEPVAEEPVAEQPAPVAETVEAQPEEVTPIQEDAQTDVIPVVITDGGEGESDEDEDEDEEDGVNTVRFNRSFTAKIILSKRDIKAYFAEVANYILSFDKVKSRMSWKALTFNKGRTVLAKLGMRGKTLWLFLALDPEEFMETKYFGDNFSGTAQYEKVPYGVKIKSERGVKFAKELVDVLMQRLGIEPGQECKQFKAKNYPKDTQENLIERGLIKVYSDGEIEEGSQLVAAGFNVRETVTAVEAHNLMSDSVAMELLETDQTEEEAATSVESSEKKNGKKDIINIDTLSDNFSAGDEVTLAALKEKGLVAKNVSAVKVLARGSLNKPLRVIADDFSSDAIKMIVLTGGKAVRHV